MPPTDGESPGDAPMTPYQRLIRDTREAKGMTPTDLARRAKLPRSTIYAVEGKEPKERPEDATIDKLAGALDLSRESILDAVSESLGLRVSYGRPALVTQQLMDRVGTLPVDVRDLWFKMARAMVDVLATHSTGTVSTQTEVSPGSHNDHHWLPAVTTERIDLTSDIAAVLGRLSRLAETSPELREELVARSEELFRRYDSQQTGE